MSGGSFDYNCFRISQFAEELRNKIDENTIEKEGYAPHYGQETIRALDAAQIIIEFAGKMAHDVEWLYSGDISEETFLARYYNNMES
jgi:hypothetical protein